jgi:hypothetical protein
MPYEIVHTSLGCNIHITTISPHINLHISWWSAMLSCSIESRLVVLHSCSTVRLTQYILSCVKQNMNQQTDCDHIRNFFFWELSRNKNTFTRPMVHCFRISLINIHSYSLSAQGIYMLFLASSTELISFCKTDGGPNFSTK